MERINSETQEDTLLKPESCVQQPPLQINEAPFGGVSGNTRGSAIQQRVAKVIRGLPYVEDVRLTEKDSTEDAQKIDGVVYIALDQDRTINTVNIQVRSSAFGERRFRNTVRRQLKAGAATSNESLWHWLAENKLILINGGERKSRRSGELHPITDKQIITSFTEQLHLIEEQNAGQKCAQTDNK